MVPTGGLCFIRASGGERGSAAGVQGGSETEMTDQNSAAAGRPEPHVKLDTSNLKSSYCNVCNATSTREEVVLNFGVNQNWDQQTSDFKIELHHRIILSPFAAKRLQDILNQLMNEYDARYGKIG